MTLRTRKALVASVAVMMIISVLAGCSKDYNNDPQIPQAEKKIRLVEDALGKRLVNTAGQSIYFFSTDFAGTNTCSGGCEALWPIVSQNLTASDIGDGLQFSDFNIIDLPNGRKQTTYKGWPLYYYAPIVNGVNTREGPGETKGEGLGGVWFVAKPDYNVMIAVATIKDQSTGINAQKKFFVDDRGRTLYLFAKDDKNPNTLSTNCVDGCITNWPVFFNEKVVPPSVGILKTDFSSIIRNDGPNGSQRNHATYKGKPLYYFINDTTRGKAEGNGVLGAGDLWFVVDLN